MNRFAALLDRLAYEHSRNNKLRLITDYLRRTPDPERGYALAALTDALSFQHAKPGVIRALMTTGSAPLTPEESVAARAELVDLVDDGLIDIEDRLLRITAKGKPFIRNVAAFFDTYLRHAAKEGPVYSRAI